MSDLGILGGPNGISGGPNGSSELAVAAESSTVNRCGRCLWIARRTWYVGIHWQNGKI